MWCGLVIVGWLGRACTTLHCTHHMPHVGSETPWCLSFSLLFLLALSVNLISDAVATDIESSRTGAWWASGIWASRGWRLVSTSSDDAECEAVLAWKESELKLLSPMRHHVRPSIPQELPTLSGRGPTCDKVTFSLSRQTCAVAPACEFGPYQCGHTDTRTSVYCL